MPSPSSLRNLVPPDSPVDNIAVPSGVALIVCQVLSPLKNLVVTELPDPSLATLTVPEPKFDAFKAVKFAPLTAGSVEGNLASGTVPEVKLLAERLVKSIACQELSPLKKVELLAVPLPNLAVATVPEDKLLAFKAVNEVPAPLNPVEVNNPVEGL